MTKYGTWVSYSGTARVGLAVALLAVAGCAVYAGTRLPLPARAVRARTAVVNLMIVIWVVAIAAFLVCLSLYVHQERLDHIAKAPPTDPIAPVTLIAVGATFVIILISSPLGWQGTLASAVIGALAAPMIFELPFDLIIMARIYPPVPPDPALYRALFFVPLFAVEIVTLSLLAVSPLVKLSRITLFCFASVLVVFAVWALFGFAYPSAPAPIALNVLSKLLAFVTALSLFLPRRQPAPERAAGTPASSMPT